MPEIAGERGFAIPAVLLVLLGLMLFLTAGFHASRLDLLAARSLAGSIRAFQAAEAGLALLEAGGPPGIDSTSLSGVSLDLRVDTLRAAGDGQIILRHRACAETIDAGGRITGRREVGRLWRLEPDGSWIRMSGGWRETIRLDPP